MRTLSLILVVAVLLAAPNCWGQDPKRDGRFRELAELERQIAAKEKELAELKAKANTLLYAINAPFELTKIDRTIAKEPAYKTEPKYCLLVFGPDAKSRVWLVLDGDVLYVDRNGNGDLTEKGERIKETRVNDETSQFPVGELPSPDESSFPALALYRYKLPGGKESMRIELSFNRKHWYGVFRDFAPQAKDAPIIHFNLTGPLTFVCPDQPTFIPGKTTTLRFFIGTPGLGQQTFARRVEAQSIVGGGARLLAEIEYPSKDPGAKPHYATITLPIGGDYGDPFKALVRVPEDAGAGHAKITLLPTLLPERTRPRLVPVTLFVPVVRAETAADAVLKTDK
jgi:hypothetical protein